MTSAALMFFMRLLARLPLSLRELNSTDCPYSVSVAPALQQLATEVDQRLRPAPTPCHVRKPRPI